MAEILDDLMQMPGFAMYVGTHYREILDLRLNGTRIGLLPAHLALGQTARAEAIAVANVLVCEGVVDGNVIKRDRPDFEVETSGSRLFVEHTRVYPGCQSDSADFARQEAAALNSDEGFRAAIGHRTVLITIDHSAVPVTPVEALTEPCPLEHVTKSEARAMIREIRNLGSSGFFTRISGGPTINVAAHDAKTLAKYRAECSVDTAISDEHAGISLMTRQFMPGKVSLADAVLWQVERKKIAAQDYPVMPDWLVVEVVQQADEFAYDLSGDALINPWPYKKVLVLKWHDGRPFVAKWSAQTDGTVIRFIPDLPEIVQPFDDKLHAWSRRVYDALDPYRISAIIADPHTHRHAEMTSDPLTVQWYRKWTGPSPWVMCTTNGDSIRMHFWVAGNWEARETADIHPDHIEMAAERIWNFLNPNSEESLVPDRPTLA